MGFPHQPHRDWFSMLSLKVIKEVVIIIIIIIIFFVVA